MNEPNILTRFTCGDCSILAVELHKKRGYRLAIANASTHGARHAFCIDDNGDSIDINGRNRLTKIRKQWGPIKELANLEELQEIWRADIEEERYSGSKQIARHLALVL